MSYTKYLPTLFYIVSCYSVWWIVMSIDIDVVYAEERESVAARSSYE